VKVLVTKPSLYERDELEEFFQSQSWEPFFAEEPRTMYQMLSRDDYDVVLYNLSSTDDFAAIRYINRNYPNIRVIVSTDDRLVNTIMNIQKGQFTVTKKFDDLCNLEKLFSEMKKPLSGNESISFEPNFKISDKR
jgi:DNA-binding NtrC family response regulator